MIAQPSNAATSAPTETETQATPIQAYVYMVECADGTLYTGWTTDLARRVAAHNAGRGARYTRARKPVRLVYWEAAATRRAAMQREYAIKQLDVAAKQQLARSLPKPIPALENENLTKLSRVAV